MNGDSYSARDGGRSRDFQGRGDRENRRDRDRGDRDRRERDRGDREGHRERRRSRSPHGRPARRDFDGDSYSSSRNFREREREERYTGGRRDEREWDRSDRGPRRDHRRDDADRPPRRDRDLFEDRRSGGRGGRDRDMQGNRGGERRKSNSPPPKKKEKTPDLTDVVSVLTRQRRLTQWDLKPPGYESVTAEQAKLSGMFPLPGAPRQQPMDPSKLKAFMDQPSSSVSTTALKPSNARQSKRVFLYNLPSDATEESVIEFFNLQLNGLNVTEGVDPCTSAQISSNREFALLEFRNPIDVTVALAMDGVSMSGDAPAQNGASNGTATKGLALRRPKDYIAPAPEESPEPVTGPPVSTVPDSPNKISMTNIPPYLNEEQVSELLTAFGTLRSFVLVKDLSTQESRGIAFFEYADASTTTIAVEGLDGTELGDKVIRVKLASVGITQAAGLEMNVAAMSMFAGTTSTDLAEGRVLQLLNMVSPEELIDNEEYEEIVEDVRSECSKYGPVVDIKIPRPSGGSRQTTGVGKIFVRFENKEGASKALRTLAGRKFADRTVVTTYFSEESYEVNAW